MIWYTMTCRNITSSLPDMTILSCGQSRPLFGLTQYCLGAVVFTLKMMAVLVGFISVRFDVTTSVNGPSKRGK